MKFINKLLRRDIEGATAIEYGLIAALIAVAAITAMNGLSGALNNDFQPTLLRRAYVRCLIWRRSNQTIGAAGQPAAPFVCRAITASFNR